MNLSTKPEPVVPLSLANDSRFGGKALGLARLKKCGLQVPDGFCVQGGGLERKEDIVRAYDALGGAVAVRSSASNEDGSKLSAAGQFDSVLHVKGHDALFSAIDTCMASLRSRRAGVYFAKETMADAIMTVVVQQMVPAAVSGVLFTVDPQSVVSMSSHCVIEACCGDGEQLVSGHVQAEQYRVHRESRDVASDGCLLDDDMLRQLLDDALHAEQSLGYPLDLEWAIDANGMLHWLQARPITSLFAVGPDELDTQPVTDDAFFTRANIGEMMPGAATPLTIDVFGAALDCGFQGLYGASGALPGKSVDSKFIASFYNHLFIDFTMLFSIVGRVAGTSAEALEVSVLGRELPEKPVVTRVDPLRRSINFARYLHYVMGYKRAIRRLERLRDTVLLASRDSAPDQYAAITDYLPVYNQVTTLHLQVSAYSGALNGALREILRRGGLQTDAQMAVIASLLLHIDGIESAEIIKSLELVAVLAKRDAHAIDNKDAFSQWLTDAEGIAPAQQLFGDFIQKNGHRCVREAELSESEWGDDKDELAHTIWQIMQREGNSLRHDNEVYSLNDVLASIVADYPKVNIKALRAVARRARAAVCSREYTKSILIQMSSRLRHGYRGLARLLCADGILSEPSLVFFFKHQELGQLLSGTLAPASAANVTLARQHWYRSHRDLRFADYGRGRPMPIRPKAAGGVAGHFSGMAVSPGKVVGTVRVVTTKQDAKALRQGEIMCARFTDVGWTPYYGVICGLITEIGSSLSHGAVVAREYRLPLVSSIDSATHVFNDGDVVELDGSAGTVRVIERAIAS